MTKPNPPSPRDEEIISNATHYSVVYHRTRTIVPDESGARALAQNLVAGGTRGSMVYAVGMVCGVEASALLTTYKPSGNTAVRQHQRSKP